MKAINNDIQVSVICLAYNHEKYIRQTLEGFINQKTDFPFEVLINDDASTDGTADIIHEYQDKYPDMIKATFQKENQYSQGRKITKDFLFPQAKGKYIAYCEGDDFWSDVNKLQNQYEIMENHPECSICVHKVKRINEDGTELGDVLPGDRYKIKDAEGVLSDQTTASALWVYGYYPFQTSSYFMRREVLEERYYNEPEFAKYLVGDQVMMKISLKLGKFYYINKSMSCYRKGVSGSWNDRFNKTEYKSHVNHRINELRGDFYFDKYSDYKYHDYIQACAVQKILRIALSWDVDEAYELIQEFDVDEKDAKELIPKGKYWSFVILKYYKPLFWSIRSAWRLKHHGNTEVL